MVHAHAADLEASLVFYRHLQFVVHADDVDGEGTRCVRLLHPRAPGMLLHLRDAPHLANLPPIDRRTPPPMWPVLLTLVVDDHIDWLRRLEHADIPAESKVTEPWGVWVHVRDPSGNWLCITTNDLY